MSALIGSRIAVVLLGLVTIGALGVHAQLSRASRPGHVRSAIIDGSVAKSFASWGELKGYSSLVVLATAGGQQPSSGPNDTPYTITAMHVDRVLFSRGNGSLPTVDVRQVGGTLDGVQATMPEFPLLVPGRRYLLFLVLNTLDPSNYYTVGAYQGVFIVGSDGLVNSLSQDPSDTKVLVHDEHLDQVLQEIAGAPDETPHPR